MAIKKGKSASEATADQKLRDAVENPIPSHIVPAGWTPRAWRDRLFYMAKVCEAVRPEIAKKYREAAGKV